jgi:membrane protein DedA with SNARE-associated domain
VLASLTSFVGDHGVYAVFGLMVVAAVLPAASELTMLYAGAVAAGAFTGAHVSLFGARVTTPASAFAAMAIAGVLGNLCGAVGGWALGAYGGRPFLERYGRLLHVTDRRLDRTQRWFARFGAIAVPLGLATPVVRSFVAIPAGIAELPLRRFIPLAALGIAAFCFGLAGLGWAVGRSYQHVHGALRYVDYAVVAGVVLLGAYWLVRRRRRSSTLTGRAGDPTH